VNNESERPNAVKLPQMAVVAAKRAIVTKAIRNLDGPMKDSHPRMGTMCTLPSTEKTGRTILEVQTQPDRRIAHLGKS
jgi:hypothetical protein